MKYWLKLVGKFSLAPVAVTALAAGLLISQKTSLAQQTVPTPTPPTSSVIAPEGKADEANFRRVTNRLQCQCGCSYMALDCNMVQCPSAMYIRKTVRAGLDAGKSEDTIVADFVTEFGPRILPEPPTKGFSLSAWIMPFAVLLLGGAMVVYILWRWRRQSAAATAMAGAATAGEPSQSPAAALVEKYRARIDRELEND